MLTSPIEPSLDPSQRVLSLPLAALYEAPIALGALAGLPAGALDIVSANFTLLDAIGQGLLLRPEPDVSAFVRTLFRHASRAEDPAVWSHTLLSYGQVLWSTPDEEAHALLRAVLAGAPDAFDDPLLVRTFWQLRRRLPEDVLDQILDRWLAGSDEQRQAAGEFVGGLAVVSRDENPQSRRATPILAGGPSPARTGFAFSAVAAWSEGDPALRMGAHDIVVSLAWEPDGDLAAAIATAFSRFCPLPPDDRTRDLLAAVAANPIALEAALGHWLLDAISGLLVHPGFEEAALKTLSDGVVTEINGTFKGLMDSQFRKELGAKIRRGQRGSVADGRSPAGLAYGYRTANRIDGSGHPIRGLREVDPERAEIVQRIFREFAQGLSARTIASRLNADGIPGPRGSHWRASTINGDGKRGHGVLHNQLYVGRLVHNRTSKVPEPVTRTTRIRVNAIEDRAISMVPHLRIVDDETWEAVQARRRSYHGAKLHRTVRPRRMLSGLGTCGICGEGWIVIGVERWGCTKVSVRSAALG